MADDKHPSDLSVAEAAQILSRPALRQAIASGQITLHRRQNRSYVARAEVMMLKEQPKRPDLSILMEPE